MTLKTSPSTSQNGKEAQLYGPVFDPIVDGYWQIGETQDSAFVRFSSRHLRHHEGDGSIFSFRSFATASEYFTHLVNGTRAVTKPSLRQDFQRSMVYHWEAVRFMDGRRKISQVETKKIIKDICKKYGLPEHKIIFAPQPDKKTLAEYSFLNRRFTIYIPTLPAVLHECAHAILSHKTGHLQRLNHSPMFIWIYLDLLQKYHGISPVFFAKTANENGLNLLGNINVPQILPAGFTPPESMKLIPKLIASMPR